MTSIHRFLQSLSLIALVLTAGGCGTKPESRQEAAAEAVGTRKPSATAATVTMPSGMTSLLLEGKLKADADAEFVIGEESGSLLLVHAMTPKQDLQVSVYRADTGTKLEDAHKNPSFWAGRVPATLGYLVVLHHTGQETEYALEIEVPRELSLDNAAPAKKLSGWASAGAPVAYLIPKGVGRKVTVRLTTASPGGFLTIHGLDDGQPALKAEKRAAQFSGELPQQDTILKIHQGAKAGPFTLQAALQ